MFIIVRAPTIIALWGAAALAGLLAARRLAD